MWRIMFLSFPIMYRGFAWKTESSNHATTDHILEGGPNPETFTDSGTKVAIKKGLESFSAESSDQPPVAHHTCIASAWCGCLPIMLCIYRPTLKGPGHELHFLKDSVKVISIIGFICILSNGTKFRHNPLNIDSTVSRKTTWEYLIFIYCLILVSCGIKAASLFYSQNVNWIFITTFFIVLLFI